jgi:hypothetical protein
MKQYTGTCPMTQQELIDTFFMEYRNKVLAVAAFLDRMDRSADRNAEHDFRTRAIREALGVLTEDRENRVREIQMILSDRDTSLLEERDRQSALGAPGRSGGNRT